jgi:hypothetical protein
MEARAAYYHVLLRAVKDDRGRFRPIISDANVRWREVSNEGFKDERDAKDSAELMALAYVRKRQPDTNGRSSKVSNGIRSIRTCATSAIGRRRRANLTRRASP